MRNVIVGTAGHIDHGKSSLVEALTGTDPDRLEEEKRRGITLDLGFAFLNLTEVNLAFVDVPGHERFVRNMLAGAGGFDLVLLAISADESIKPQTREHFEICKLLGIPSGLVALTKSDLVSSDTLDLVRLEAEEFVRGSFLDGGPIVPVSARTGEGLETLRRELQWLALQTRLKDSSRHFRLPIDRAFAMKGFGTVVTGTLVSGQVAPEDEVELFPSRRRLRVRGVQTESRAVERAFAGQRTALNLAGIDHHEVGRGMVAAAPGRFEPTTRIDVRLTLLSSARPLKHRARVHFHQGTAETVAEVYLLGGGEIAPGGSVLAQLRLTDAVLALSGDRFILRQSSPLVTIGGGVVVDASAKRHKVHDPNAVVFLEILERGLGGDPAARAESLAALVSAEPRGATIEALVARTGWLEDEIHALAQTTDKVRIVSQRPLVLAAAPLIAGYGSRILGAIDQFHRASPLLEALSKEDLRARVAPSIGAEVFQSALDDLVRAGKVSLTGDLVKRSGRAVELLPEERRAKDRIEEEFARAGLTAPAVAEVLSGLQLERRRSEKLLQLLLRERTLVRVSAELVFHRAALESLRERLADFKRARGGRLLIGEFKELAGISRKYAIPLLEYLDREHVTRRVEDYRVIL